MVYWPTHRVTTRGLAQKDDFGNSTVCAHKYLQETAGRPGAPEAYLGSLSFRVAYRHTATQACGTRGGRSGGQQRFPRWVSAPRPRGTPPFPAAAPQGCGGAAPAGKPGREGGLAVPARP